MAARTTYLERYVSGEFEQVWADLVTRGEQVGEDPLQTDALTLVTRLELLTLCRLAVQLTQRQCPPPLSAGRGGAPCVYTEETLLLLALAYWLPLGIDGQPRVPSKAQQSKRLRAAGAPPSELLLVLLVRVGLWMGLTHGRDVIMDSAPILAWHRLARSPSDLGR
ncbi:MAG TPA: hypothetical protein VGS80_06900 [Ktedonobacterales bacterium]|nr:hypothetical protein [Ktedonobacterales bacterium]